MEINCSDTIYSDISRRTGGDIYIGVVGPVRTGKSTFIKRFMETMVIPKIEDPYMRERAKDELPQSGSGRTIMTAEPKFVPEDAVSIRMDCGETFSVRMIDCVGYIAEGAAGIFEDGSERMVATPWFDETVPITKAAEEGTRRVICDHSTIGIVVTTDGTVTDLEREAYVEPERRVITELKALEKPFIVIVNSVAPDSEKAEATAKEISEKYGVSCLVENCLELAGDDIERIIRAVLSEFPVEAVGVSFPDWVNALPTDHPVRRGIYSVVKNACGGLYKMQDVQAAVGSASDPDFCREMKIDKLDLGTGTAAVTAVLPETLFYRTVSEESGLDIAGESDLMRLLIELASVKSKYDRIAAALNDAHERGYGIVMPSQDELKLQEPEIVRRGGRYGVRLKASAPAIHMMMTDIETEVSPAVDGGGNSGEIINYLLQEFEGDTARIWDSNLFGKSLYEIAADDLETKISRMPTEVKLKFRSTLEKIVNEGGSGLICIIL